MKRPNILHTLLLAFVILSCSPQKSVCPDGPMINTPVQTDDGWQVSSLEGVQINSEKLQLLVNKICDKTYENIHSILIVKDEKLVFEQYFLGHRFQYEADGCKGHLIKFQPDTWHELMSVTKSVTSILFGIAMDQGFIEDVDDKLFKYFPEYDTHNDSLKDELTLRHLLTMISGFEWNSGSVFIKDTSHDLIQMLRSRDPLQYILEKPVVNKPGTAFYYNSANTILLGEIIHRATGMMLDDFAKKYLFDPLDIDMYQWIHIKPDLIFASSDLKLRPRDMAKIGNMMLNNGMWKDQSVLSPDWVETSTEPYVHFNKNEGYAYQWWTKNFVVGDVSVRSFYALGWGGQHIIVFPELDAVVVFTAGNYESEDPINEIIHRYVLPALKEDFKYDYKIIQREAPISDTINIVTPPQSMGEDIARLSGHWAGIGDFQIAGQLVVEEIDSTSATVIYAWGDHPDGYFERGWVRKSANINSTGEIEISLGEAFVTFKLDKTEDILIGDYRIGEGKSKLIFERVK